MSIAASFLPFPTIPHLKINITQKLSLLVIGLITVTALLISLILINGNNKVIIDQEFKLKLLTERLHAENIFRGIQNAQTHLKILRDSPAITGIIRASENFGIDPVDNSSLVALQKRISESFANIANVSPEYYQIRLIGVADEGREIVRVERNSNNSIDITPNDKLQQKAHRDYFQQTLLLGPNEIYTSEINLNREHGEISFPYTPMIRFATPVFHNNKKLFGILVININFGLILNSISESISTNDDLFIVNHNGDYLLYPDKEKAFAFAFDFGKEYKVQNEIPELAPLFANDENTTRELSIQAMLNNKNYLIQYLRININPTDNTQFIGLVHKTLYSNAVANASNVRDKGIIVAALLIFSGTFLAIFLCRVVVTPLLQLTQSARAITNGVYDVNVNYKSNDEIGILSQAFIKMIDGIRKREQSIEEREVRYRTIFKDAKESIIITDSNGVIEEVNPATEKIFGYRDNEIIGKNITLLYPSMNSDQQAETQNIVLKDSFRGESNARHKNNIEIPSLLSISKLYFSNGIHFSSIISDLTEQKEAKKEKTKLQLQLQQSQKMESIGQLSSGLAHDFNNVLGSVLGYSDLAMNSFNDGDTSRLNHYLTETHNAAQHGSEIVKQLLIFSREQKVELKNVNIEEIVTKTIKLVQSTIPHNIKINVEYQANLPLVQVNPVQLQQIILNLCINAKDAIDGAGKITIATRHQTYLNTNCSSCHENFTGHYIEISIHDSGSGIGSDYLQRIFEPFFTSKGENKGTGMGLAMVHGMMHSAGGHILVESSPETGTVFRLLLKIVRD